ncbi:MAG: STAS domain-containing protein, partial [Chloroflexaceae bacterium]|nr:STAS domain-containing protein [Chloroflexaceae bacterium]
MHITRHNITVAFYAIIISGILGLLGLGLITQADAHLTIWLGIGLGAMTLLALGYWRKVAHTLTATVLLTAFLVPMAVPSTVLQTETHIAALIPTIVALILAGPRITLLCGAVTLAVIFGRIGWTGAWSNFVNLGVYGLSVALLALARLMVDIALGEAANNAQQAEAARHEAESQAQAQAQQAAALAEQNESQRRLLELVETLEVPAVRLAPGAVLVPLVGNFDPRRAEALTQRLLHQSHSQHIRHVILDVAGVPTMDEAAAQ